MATFSTLILFSEEINNTIHAIPTAQQPTAKESCKECAGFAAREIENIHVLGRTARSAAPVEAAPRRRRRQALRGQVGPGPGPGGGGGRRTHDGNYCGGPA